MWLHIVKTLPEDKKLLFEITRHEGEQRYRRQDNISNERIDDACKCSGDSVDLRQSLLLRLGMRNSHQADRNLQHIVSESKLHKASPRAPKFAFHRLPFLAEQSCPRTVRSPLIFVLHVLDGEVNGEVLWWPLRLEFECH